jgi:hypothetical protein
MDIILTHGDPIWLHTNCQGKEDATKELLARVAGEKAHVELIDIITRHFGHTIPEDRPYMITDNHFNVDTKAEVIQMGPEMWSIFSLPYDEVPDIGKPSKRMNCLIHRQSGERLMFLYKMYERDLLDNNLVSFACFTGDQEKPYADRKKDFNDLHIDQDTPIWNDLQEELRPQMPLLLPDNMLADVAAMQTEVTLVVETYVNEDVIAYSEKIFRALQLPRPWIMFNSPYAVSVLRKYGFDVLDDIVDHNNYDSVIKQERRADKILNTLNKIKPWSEIDKERLVKAAKHNRLLLAGYKERLGPKVQSVLDKFK